MTLWNDSVGDASPSVIKPASLNMQLVNVFAGDL